MQKPVLGQTCSIEPVRSCPATSFYIEKIKTGYFKDKLHIDVPEYRLMAPDIEIIEYLQLLWYGLENFYKHKRKEIMIFFGTKGKTVSGHVVEGIQCPNCNNQQFITFGVIRYFHLYWIPTFPTSKTVGIECTNCKRTIIDKELPVDLKKQINETVFNKNKIIPMFTGLILIACLILFGIYAVHQDNRQEAVYIEQPAINDLYVVNFAKIFTDVDPDYEYGLMRIKHISSGQVEFQISKIAYNKTSGVRKDIRDKKTSQDSYYDSETLNIDISKLKSMKDSGAIFSIERF